MTTKLIEMGLKLPAPIRHILFKAYKVEVKLLKTLNRNPKKLNIGGSNWFKMGWLNLDYYADNAFTDINQNLLEDQELPFTDESLEIIFTSHILEHLPDEVVSNLLKECYRVLKKRGLMRISVPDMEKAFKAYVSVDWNFFGFGGVSTKGESIERRLLNFFASFAMDNYGGEKHYSGGPIVGDKIVKEKFNSLNKYEFVKWCVSLIPKEASYKGHVNGFDYEKLEIFLKEAGFWRVLKSSYRGSTVKELRGGNKFDNRPITSLYVEAVKEKGN